MDKFTLSDFLKRYATNELCLEEIKKLRFPNGITCKKCKKITNHYKIKDRMQYACANCGTHMAPLASTIFEKTSTPLTSWFYVMFQMINTRAGISAKQIQREIGVTYKTAWRMMKQIRTLMADLDTKFTGGIVEVDETFIGGKNKNRIRQWYHGVENKEIVMGMVQRKGKVVLKHIESTGKWALLEQIQKHIDPKARIMTDQYVGYKNLHKYGYTHESVDHGKTYVVNHIHTQNIENVWSHMKRGIFGVYRHVSKKYLQTYADEYAFRYNNRKDAYKMFFTLLKEIPSIRIIALQQPA